MENQPLAKGGLSLSWFTLKYLKDFNSHRQTHAPPNPALKLPFPHEAERPGDREKRDRSLQKE